MKLCSKKALSSQNEKLKAQKALSLQNEKLGK